MQTNLASLNPPADDVDALLGRYERRVGQQLEWWRVSASERDALYRVERGFDELPPTMETLLDRENLLAKLRKWQQEGFVAARHGEADAAADAAEFMQALRQASAARRDAVARVANPGATASAQVRSKPGTPVDICDVPVPAGMFGALCPEINAAYVFGAQHQDVVLDIVENRRIMLIGHTGTGKTSLIEQVAARAGHAVLRSNMNGQTTIGDFVGFWTVKGGATIWVDGVLPIAMREGYWLIIDEIDFAEPAILAVLTAVLEPHGKLLLKEKGDEIVVPHPSFRLFATANAVGAMSRFRHLYQGANLMNEAFLDRWRVYLFDYLSRDDETEVLMRTLAPSMPKVVARTLAAIAADCRAAFAREDLSSAFSTRRLLDWAELMLRHGDPQRAAAPTIYSKVSAEDATVIRQIIRQHIALPPGA